MRLQRREAYYSGHVQGVGFRYAAVQIARPLAVTGFIRNEPDGRVRLVAEGSDDQLDRLLTAIADRQQDRITNVETTVAPATGEFDAFEIRR